MTRPPRYVFLAGIILSCILLAGCTGISPSGTVTPVPGSVPDLTNQYSGHAASFRDGGSYTVLESSQPTIRLSKVAGGFSAPVMIAAPDDGTGRMFVVDQVGVVYIVDANGSVMPEPFLDLRDRMVSLNKGYDERGLLSLAFHPDFGNNGRVFAYYSAPLREGGPAGWSCTNHLSEFSVMPGNPGKVDTASEKVLLAVDKPSMNHNGGPVLFGPDDGYLYLALGDGGGADDTGTGHAPGTGNAQDPSTLLGKIIRLDVDRPGSQGKAYAIPPDNPFVSAPGYLPEIYAMGLRNPAYLSFDAGDGHHLVAAVAGQQLFESVFIIVKGGNYGWNIREGTHCFHPSHDASPPANCSISDFRGRPLIGPVVELGHDVGTVIVGGYVYRGSAMPEFNGSYIFGDWSGSGNHGASGRIFVASPPKGRTLDTYPFSVDSLTPTDNAMWSTAAFRIADSPDGNVGLFVRGFGEDSRHELYVLTNTATGPDPAGTTGAVWKIIPA